MNSSKLPRILFVILLIAYDLLFWKQFFGINVFIFQVLLAAFLVYREKRPVKPHLRLLLLGVLLADAGVLYHDSALATVLSWLGIIIWAGLYKYPEITFSGWSLFSFAEDMLKAPFKLVQTGKTPNGSRGRSNMFLLFLVPLLAGSVFLFLYTSADSTFSDLVSRIGDKIAEFFDWLPDLLSISHLGHLLWSSLLVTALFGIWYRKPLHWLQGTFQWNRVRTKGSGTAHQLRLSWQVALSTLLTLNLLTLAFNINDISHYWFRFSVPANFDLKQFVHGGTWITVSSIVLSVLVILFIYRGNLLFWPGKPWLRWLSLAWILQNFVMGISVFFRNYHYVSFHGFAFKRLGVFFFLACLVAGLIILVLLVERKKSTVWLFEQCSIYFLLILSLLSIPDWNSIMLRYNLAHPHPSQIDSRFYLSLAPHCLPEIIRNKETVLKQIGAHQSLGARGWIHYSDEEFESRLVQEKAAFIAEFEERYNWPGYSVKRYDAYQELAKQYGELKNK